MSRSKNITFSGAPSRSKKGFDPRSSPWCVPLFFWKEVINKSAEVNRELGINLHNTVNEFTKEGYQDGKKLSNIGF